MMVRMGVVEGAGGERACGVGVGGGGGEMNGVIAVYVDTALGVGPGEVLGFMTMMKSRWECQRLVGFTDTGSGDTFRLNGGALWSNEDIAEKADMVAMWLEDSRATTSGIVSWIDGMKAMMARRWIGVVVYTGTSLDTVAVLRKGS